jgi:hypothetical protein
MRNQHPPIPPDCTLAAQGAPADPEAPFLHPNVNLKPDPLSPALHRTPPSQRSPMPNRKQKPPPQLAKSFLTRRNHTTTTILPEWRQSLIVPAHWQSSSGASLAGGCALDAKTKTRMKIVHRRLPFFPSFPEEKFHSPSCKMTPRHRSVTYPSARRSRMLRSTAKTAKPAGLPSPASFPAGVNGLTTHPATPLSGQPSNAGRPTKTYASAQTRPPGWRNCASSWQRRILITSPSRICFYKFPQR